MQRLGMFKFLVSTKNLELNKVSLIERKKYLGERSGFEDKR